MKISRLVVLMTAFGLGLWFSVLGSTRVLHAAIIGPYTADANTLHLWHLNDSAVPVLDDAGVATPINLQSLGTVAGEHWEERLTARRALAPPTAVLPPSIRACLP